MKREVGHSHPLSATRSPCAPGRTPAWQPGQRPAPHPQLDRRDRHITFHRRPDTRSRGELQTVLRAIHGPARSADPNLLRPALTGMTARDESHPSAPGRLPWRWFGGPNDSQPRKHHSCCSPPILRPGGANAHAVRATARLVVRSVTYVATFVIYYETHAEWCAVSKPPRSRTIGPVLGRGSGRLVAVAVLGGPSPLKPPVHLVGARVPPLAHPVLETR